MSEVRSHTVALVIYVALILMLVVLTIGTEANFTFAVAFVSLAATVRALRLRKSLVKAQEETRA